MRERRASCGHPRLAQRYSMTSSFRASIDCGTVRPSAFETRTENVCNQVNELDNRIADMDRRHPCAARFVD
jgi:hypothetical protein